MLPNKPQTCSSPISAYVSTSRAFVKPAASIDTRCSLCESVQRLAIDVGDQVAKPIDEQDLPAKPLGACFGYRDLEAFVSVYEWPECSHVHASRQPRRRRREPIAAFERAAHRRPGVLAFGELDDPARRNRLEDRGQHAVVGGDEPVVAGFGRDAAPRRPDAGIDDRKKDGAGGKVAARPPPAAGRREGRRAAGCRA